MGMLVGTGVDLGRELTPVISFIYNSLLVIFLIEWYLRISDLGFYAVIIIQLLLAKNSRS
jgi:hypothetical protein